MRLVLVSLATLTASAAQAQVAAVPPFVGDYSEGFDNAPGGFLPCLDLDAPFGTVCATDMLSSSSWSFSCQIAPHSGAKFAGSTGTLETFTFSTPVSQVGGYFATNSGPGNTVTFQFFDAAGTLIDTVVEPLGNCVWDWRGYASPTPIAVMTASNSAYGGGFVDLDDLEFSVTPIADADGDGFETGDGDCDDNDANTYPGATEICDGRDNDCDGALPANEQDGDGDGAVGCEDCDDTNAQISPFAPDLCDGIDNNCDGYLNPLEVDDDGDGLAECQDDCDDTDADRAPGLAEICDGKDNDCDGGIDADEFDNDGDGFAICSDDCDDGDANIFPTAVDIPGDGIDQDCDGSDATGGGTATGDAIPTDIKPGGCGCTSAPGPVGTLALLPLLALALRRRD